MADKLGAMKPQKKIELFSANYFAACTLGGIIACGPTHTMVTPLDLVSLSGSTSIEPLSKLRKAYERKSDVFPCLIRADQSF
jgi:hypothetical protein